MEEQREVGVGPHSLPWPTDKKYDKVLLEYGDRRNVEDKYRYWTIEAIKAEMGARAESVEIAIENWQHDSNIGTIVRTANAFNVAKVHVIGKRQWNRRGAMVTDRYMTIEHHETVEDFVLVTQGMHKIAIDNVAGAVCLGDFTFHERSVLIFGGEGPGVSMAMRRECEATVMIEQYGSTRSINVGVAAGIVMYEWRRNHKKGIVQAIARND